MYNQIIIQTQNNSVVESIKTNTAKFIGKTWKLLTPLITMDRIATLSLIGSIILGGVVSATADTLAGRIEGITVATAATSFVCLLWAMGCAASGNYRKASEKLAFGTFLGICCYGNFQIGKALNKAPNYTFPGHQLLSTNPPQPTRSYPIKWPQAENWINAHPCAIQKRAARKLVEATVHISHKKFMKALQHSTNQFNQWLDTQKSRNYTMVTPTRTSNQWVSSLALNYLKEMPIQAAQSTTRGGWIHSRLLYPDTKILAFADDAAYSGTQTAKAIYEIVQSTIPYFCKEGGEKECTHYTIALIIPFMRDPNMFDEISTQFKHVSVQIFTAERLPTVGEALTEKEFKSLGISRATKVTAYFDHKMPDFVSVPEDAYEGKVLLFECPEDLSFLQRAWAWAWGTNFGLFKDISGVDTRFIDPITPPYR